MSYISGALIGSSVGVTPHIEMGEKTDDFTAGYVAVFTYAVPAGKTFDLAEVGVSDIMGGAWRLRIGTNDIIKGRTSPGNPDSDKSFRYPYPIASGETLSLEFCSRDGAPTNVTVFGYLAGALRG
jgi:hypothetical protein